MTTQPVNVLAVGLDVPMGQGSLYNDSVQFTPNHSGYATVNIEASNMTDAQGGTFPRIILKNSGYNIIDHDISPYNYSYPLNPPDVDINLPPVWLDKGVTYTLEANAVGASDSNEFDGACFMNATVNYQKEVSTTSNVSKIAGGLRIKSIKAYDQDGSFVEGKNYDYSQASLITPEVFLKEHFLELEVLYFILGGSCTAQSGFYRKFASGGTVRDLTLQGGSPVVYGKVDEYIVDSNNNDIGRTTYAFDIKVNDLLPVPIAYKGGLMLLNKDWMGGQNRMKSVFKNSAIDDDDFISSESLDYVLKRHDSLNSYKMYKVIPFAKLEGACTYFFRDLPNNSISDYMFIEYPIYSGVKLLSSTVKTSQFNQGSDLVETTNLAYDNETHLQPTKIETTKSNGDKIITRTRYPDDFISKSLLVGNNSVPGGSLSDSEYTAVNKMQVDELHQIAIPIQTESYKKEGSTETLLSIQRTGFDEKGSDQIVTESIQTSKESGNLEPRIVYQNYDSKGNPLEVSKKDGASVVYVWGYNSEYPVAKIENATQTQVDALNLDMTLINSTATSDSDIRLELDNIRTNLPNALVITYTYDPLIGVTSITDPKGQTIYYEYDDFGRLEYVKDDDGYVLSKNEYHYKSQ